MRRRFLFLCAVLLFGTSLQAQALTLVWDVTDAVTPAVAQSWIYTVYVNNASSGVLTGVTCAVTAGVLTCRTSTLPASVTIGANVQLTAKTAMSGESARSVPFIQPPSAPTNLRSQ